MRETKLSPLAENVNYALGVATGMPTKLPPPIVNQASGKFPDQGFAAQWQNYIEHHFQRQIERSAQLPFRNFSEIGTVPATTSIPRFSFNKAIGATLIANGVNNAVQYYQEFLDAVPITFVPTSGTFVPKDVAAVDDPLSDASSRAWIVVGSNSTAPLRAIWEVRRDNTTVELTMPSAGSVELIAKDYTTGDFYAFAADTNRSVYKRDPFSGLWSALGQRGSGAVAPTQSMSCAANNGTLLLFYSIGGSNDPRVEVINTTSFSSTTVTIPNGSIGGAALDVRWSPQLQAFMFLGQRGRWTTSTPLVDVSYQLRTQFDNPSSTGLVFPGSSLVGGNQSILGGCLTDTGAAAYGSAVTGSAYLAVQDWIDSAPHMLAFGNLATSTTGVYCRFDGSAIWFCIDKAGSKRLFRSLRS